MGSGPEKLVLDPVALRARAERCRRIALTLARDDAAMLEALAREYDAEAARLEAVAAPVGDVAVPPAVADAAREAAALAEGVPGIEAAVASTVEEVVANPPASASEPLPVPAAADPDDAEAKTQPPATDAPGC